MNKKYIFLWVTFALLAVILLKQGGKDQLRVIMCDVGQGDAFLITYKNTQMLIDGGPNDKVLGCLRMHMPLFDHTIEWIVATHPDADHISGIIPVIKEYKVDQIITNGMMSKTKVFSELTQLIAERHIHETTANDGDVFEYEKERFLIVWPPQLPEQQKQREHCDNIDTSSKNEYRQNATYSSTNACSVVIKLEFGDFSALFTGDLEIGQEQILISSGKLTPVTVLKVGHHGSTHSTSQEFLEKTRPKLAFISVGKKNSYGHPTKRVLDLLSAMNIRVFRTDRDGEVELETDGTRVWQTDGWYHKISL